MIDCTDPENKDDPTCRITEEDIAKEAKATGGGLGNYVGGPIKDAVDKLAKDLCNEQGGELNAPGAPKGSCRVNGRVITRFADIVGREVYKKAFISQIKQDNIPSYLFVGPYGTGKTAFSEALVAEYATTYGSNPEEYKRTNLLEVSGRNGIDFVRDHINKFIKTRGFSGSSSHFRKFIILDEADDLSQDAQRQLKTVYNDIQRTGVPITMILISNHPGRMLPDITQSGRFRVVDFDKLSDDELFEVAKIIAPNSTITKTVLEYSDGNIRDLMANLDNLASGLPIKDYRLQDIEQAEKATQKEEQKIEVLKRQRFIAIRREAESRASQYTNDDLLADLYRIQSGQIKTENAPDMELILREALKYRGASDAEIRSGLKEYEKKQKETARANAEEAQRRLEENPVYAAQSYVRRLGGNPSEIGHLSSKFSGVVGKYYEQIKVVYTKYFELKGEGKDAEAEKYFDTAFLYTADMETKYPGLDDQISAAQKQAFKDARENT